MATFYISRKKQEALIIEGCGGHDTQSRENRVRIAKVIKEMLPEESFEPLDVYSYDLSLLLEKLNEDEHAEVFEAFINLY